jgi:16S rRNA (uracil1498-N3)-methyltransferase
MDHGDETVLLPKEEAEHLIRVLRLGPGDTVAVFDGRGMEFLAKVVTAERRDVRVQVLSRVEPAAEAAVPITLVQAVLKGDKMDDIVRDAVMLGVAAIQPIVSARTEVTVAALTRGGRLDRWRRVALASVKQSRRAVIPDVRGPLTFESWLDEPQAAATLMLVEPGAASGAEPLSILREQKIPSDAAIVVGPEGGWTDEEWAAAGQRGVRTVTLGHRTLRADAVPIAAISVLQFLWGDL